MSIKHILKLELSEVEKLKGLVKGKNVAARKRLHAQILLKSDQGDHNPQGKWADTRIAAAFDVTEKTVANIRKKVVMDGLDVAIERPRSPRPNKRKLDGAGEARLIAEACSTPPKGAASWSLRLLSERLVELEIVDSISTETIRKIFKKKALQENLWVNLGSGRFPSV